MFLHPDDSGSLATELQKLIYTKVTSNNIEAIQHLVYRLMCSDISSIDFKIEMHRLAMHEEKFLTTKEIEEACFRQIERDEKENEKYRFELEAV
jgi:hypothetical protein